MRQATEGELNSWFQNGNGLAVVCGRVSGNLETLDFDAPELYEPWRELVRELAPGLFEKLTVAKSPSGGYHVPYRCERVEGNQKLAVARVEGEDGKHQIKTLIETRGEGGYIIVPPSPASCHPANRPYETLYGDWASVPVLTEEERKILLACAKSFNQDADEAAVPGEGAHKGNGNQPGDDYNSTFTLSDWDGLLTRHGWQRVAESKGTQYWPAARQDRSRN